VGDKNPKLFEIGPQDTFDERFYKMMKVFCNMQTMFLLVIDNIENPGDPDIDLVVEGLPAEQYIKALTELYDILPPGVELNLIPFEDAFDSLKRKAVAEGQLLYG
jgi:hypothetical protein